MQNSLTIVPSVSKKAELKYGDKRMVKTRTLREKFEHSSPYLLLIPVLTLLTVVILIPEIMAFLLSFTTYSPGDVPVYVGFKNYIEILKDPNFLNALINNLIFLGAIICFEFLVGFGIALLLNHGFPLQRLWVSLIIAPYAISPVVACVIWRYMLDPNYGFANYIISSLGFSPVLWFGSTATSFIAIIIVDVWKYSPFITIIAYAALVSLPIELFEVANIDGANTWQSFRFITLPLIAPALMVAIVFRVIFALREFGIIWILTQGGPGRKTEILSVYLYKETFRYHHFGRGATIAVFMLILTALLSINLVRKMYRRMY